MLQDMTARWTDAYMQVCKPLLSAVETYSAESLDVKACM